MTFPVSHGGNLSQAMQSFGGHQDAWLDLSTGISPVAFEFDSPRPDVWARLPEATAIAALQNAAADAYGVRANAAVVVAGGTQAVIAALPICRPASDVAVVGFTYTEHALAWRRAGHRVVSAPNLKDALEADVVVLTNPNNPDGYCHTQDDLLQAAQVLRKRNGLLVVDEAFADVQPEHSITSCTDLDSVVVTRSFGKFFGLAGLRIGFAVTGRAMAQRIEAQLGPWPAAGPSIAVATTALRDRNWQHIQRRQLKAQCTGLNSVLTQSGLKIVGGTDLFTLIEHANAQAIWEHLARHYILTRRFEERPTWLRFGLAANDAALSRLATTLAEYFEQAA